MLRKVLLIVAGCSTLVVFASDEAEAGIRSRTRGGLVQRRQSVANCGCNNYQSACPTSYHGNYGTTLSSGSGMYASPQQTGNGGWNGSGYSINTAPSTDSYNVYGQSAGFSSQGNVSGQNLSSGISTVVPAGYTQ
ncbi:MAG: hypothetical protein SGI77_17735 [Pirellulaceae bacterium]|nr:hypothetical protein [Pirellulaceae bacterium]